MQEVFFYTYINLASESREREGKWKKEGIEREKETKMRKERNGEAEREGDK